MNALGWAVMVIIWVSVLCVAVMFIHGGRLADDNLYDFPPDDPIPYRLVCDHSYSKWGRCGDCGMTWEEQARQVAEREDATAVVAAVQHRADVRPCGHTLHDPSCIDPAAVERIRSRVMDEVAARRVSGDAVRWLS